MFSHRAIADPSLCVCVCVFLLFLLFCFCSCVRVLSVGNSPALHGTILQQIATKRNATERAVGERW
jgi:hypothetical protein